VFDSSANENKLNINLSQIYKIKKQPSPETWLREETPSNLKIDRLLAFLKTNSKKAKIGIERT
jgi:hypothetical protein